MPQVIQSPRARRDLLEIWLYVARNSATLADRVTAKIDQKCQLVAQFPLMGQDRSDLSPDLRSIAAAPYIIFYRAIAGGIEIARVIHGVRDIPTQFQDEPD